MAFVLRSNPVMATYKSTKKLSPTQAAYIAGLIDGEGTITLQRRHANENRRLAITISSTEVQLLEFVRNATGVGTITTKKTYQSHHASSFTYGVYSRQALALLSQVHKHLLTYKKTRSELILSKYVELTPRNGKYTTQQREARDAFEHAVLGTKPNSVQETQPVYLACA